MVIPISTKYQYKYQYCFVVRISSLLCRVDSKSERKKPKTKNAVESGETTRTEKFQAFPYYLVERRTPNSEVYE